MTDISVTITITISRPATQVADIYDSLDRAYSPWIKSTVTDDEKSVITHSDPDRDDEGEYTGHKVITHTQLFEAFAVLYGQDKLCCGQDMLDEEMGYACSNDADLILQQAVLGDIVYG